MEDIQKLTVYQIKELLTELNINFPNYRPKAFYVDLLCQTLSQRNSTPENQTTVPDPNPKRKLEQSKEPKSKKSKEDSTQNGVLIQTENNCEHFCDNGILEAYCEECNDTYCNSCFITEHKSKKKSGHQKKPLSMKKQMCTNHQELLDHYCFDCNLKLCVRCLILSHKLHKTSSIENAEIDLRNNIYNIYNIKDAQESLKISIQENQAQIEYFQKTISNLNQHLQELILFENNIKSTNDLQDLLEISKKRYPSFCLRTIKIQSIIQSMIQIKNGNILTCSNQGIVRFYDETMSKMKYQFICNNPLRCLFQKKDENVLSVYENGTIDLLSVNEVKDYVKEYKVSPIKMIIEGNNDDLIFLSKENLTIRKQNLDIISTKTKNSFEFNSILRLKEGNFLLSITKDKYHKIMLIDKEFQTINKIYCESKVVCLLNLKDGSLVLGLEDGSIKIYDNLLKNCLITLKTHTKRVVCLIETRNGYLVSGSADSDIIIWKNNNPIHLIGDHNRSISCLIETRNGNLISASNDDAIKVWTF